MTSSIKREPLVLVPPDKVNHVLFEFIKGLVRRLSQQGLVLNEERAMEYFRERSLNSSYEDFTDSSREWYLAVLKKSSCLAGRLLQRNNPVILDIGCGRGGLFNWLCRNVELATYFGIDQDRYAIDHCRTHFDSGTFIEGDIRRLTSVFDKRTDVTFAVNVFPYICDPGDVLTKCRQLARSTDAVLAILDPAPSPYWEKEFGGFGIELREATDLIERAREAGWTLSEQINLAMTSLFGLPMVKLAHLLIFNPEPSMRPNKIS